MFDTPAKVEPIHHHYRLFTVVQSKFGPLYEFRCIDRECLDWQMVPARLFWGTD